MFGKILIANRGEIACRVIRTCRRLGIRTVAVFSAADAAAQHVILADEAVPIGPAPARESYLVIDRIIEAARATGAEAIHPGYGFLSERADFAEACVATGIVFVGPRAAAIRAMGLKGAAKALMERAGVPIVPGYHGDAQGVAELMTEAERIGWPVLIKAVAGGGGKGMRRVDNAADFEAALAGAKREAMAAFGDDKVLLEKYLLRPRHIEVQVFGDSHGNIVQLFERDCSIQRRHQKVVEEAPAPGMTVEMRAAMGAAAVAAARAVDYIGAGTVEFIADVSQGLSADRFYFMEMNTRLQVEHPVTEMITGQDLVEWQLRVAVGEVLPLKQSELAINGHAVEARLYAENPRRNFQPSTGRLLRFRAPAPDGDLRIDSGVAEGDVVTPHYDPMLAKVVAWAPDRATATGRLAGAMGAHEIAGLQSNAAFLGRVLRHRSFVSGDVDTGFIPAHIKELEPLRSAPENADLAFAAVALHRRGEAGAGALVLRQQTNEMTVDLVEEAGAYRLGLSGGVVSVRVTNESDGVLNILLEGVAQRAAVVHDGKTVWVARDGETNRFDLVDPAD